MTNPLLSKHAQEIRDMWQSRALAESDGRLRRVLMVVLTKEYAAAMPILLRVTFPGFEDIKLPFLSGYATIMQSGRMVCDETIDKFGTQRRVAVYENQGKFIADMRALADKLKLSDAERTEMFGVLQKWVVADLRIGPHGERLAS